MADDLVKTEYAFIFKQGSNNDSYLCQFSN